MYAGGRCVSMTDACLMHDFFFSNHKCFPNQSGNKCANTCAAHWAIMTWTGRRWHKSHGQKGCWWVKVRWRQRTWCFFSLVQSAMLLIIRLLHCAFIHFYLRSEIKMCKDIVSVMSYLLFPVILIVDSGEQVVTLVQVQQKHRVTSDHLHAAS